MLQPNITEEERKLYSTRSSILKSIDSSISKNRFAAVLAHSGMGRTTLLRHVAADKGYFYLDLRKLSLSPENFAIDFIGSICAHHLANSISEIATYQSWEKIKELDLKQPCKDIIDKVDNELQKIKPDQKLILQSTFAFAEQIAEDQKKKTTIILNNVDELLKLNNFSQIKDAVSIFFNSIHNNKECSFIVASSAIQVMSSILKRYTKEIIDIPPLSHEETKELFERIAGKTDERVVRELHIISGGIPLVVRESARRFKKEKTSDTNKNVKLIRYIISSELATTSSLSYSYCSRLFTGSLNRARGEALLKTIIKVVSQNEPLRLTEIGRLVYRSGPVTKSLLERLIEVDLIVKDGKTFDFANPVLKLWCSLMFSSIEFNTIPDEKSLSESGGLR